MSILSPIPTRLLTVLLAITKRSSQVRPADNTPGGKKGGEEVESIANCPGNKAKTPKRKLRKSFYLKTDFSRFFAQSLSGSEERGSAAFAEIRAPEGRPGAPRGGRRATHRSPMRSGTLGSRRCSAPTLCPTPGSRSSGGRRPCRFFVTRFRSFRERAGGRGALGAGRPGTQPRAGRPSKTAARARPAALQEYPLNAPTTSRGPSRERVASIRRNGAPASVSRYCPKDSRWGEWVGS